MLLRDQDAGEGARKLEFLGAQEIYKAVAAYWSSPRDAPEDERGVYWERMDDGRCGILGCVFPWSLCTEEFESLTLFEMFTSGMISEEVYLIFKKLDKISYTYDVHEWPKKISDLGVELGFLQKELDHGKKESQDEGEAEGEAEGKAEGKAEGEERTEYCQLCRARIRAAHP